MQPKAIFLVTTLLFLPAALVAYPAVFLASADVRFFKQVTCPVWSKDKITQK
jgi:hypothetical protein